MLNSKGFQLAGFAKKLSFGHFLVTKQVQLTTITGHLPILVQQTRVSDDLYLRQVSIGHDSLVPGYETTVMIVEAFVLQSFEAALKRKLAKNGEPMEVKARLDRLVIINEREWLDLLLRALTALQLSETSHDELITKSA